MAFGNPCFYFGEKSLVMKVLWIFPLQSKVLVLGKADAFCEAILITWKSIHRSIGNHTYYTNFNIQF